THAAELGVQAVVVDHRRLDVPPLVVVDPEVGRGVHVIALGAGVGARGVAEDGRPPAEAVATEGLDLTPVDNENFILVHGFRLRDADNKWGFNGACTGGMRWWSAIDAGRRPTSRITGRT